MKKTFIGVVLIILITALVVPVIYGAPLKATKVEARHVIGRTAAVIVTARQCAVQGKKYEGLGLAVAHQLRARQLFNQGDFIDSIFHSLRARVLTSHVIAINKSGLLNEALYDRLEERFTQGGPSDQELDTELKGSNVEIMNDQAAGSANIELGVD